MLADRCSRDPLIIFAISIDVDNSAVVFRRFQIYAEAERGKIDDTLDR
jgi:hypothetical protein